MKFKEFILSSWAIKNKISVYVITLFIVIFGVKSYNNLPKESFPDIVVPTIYINTVYAGNTPTNIENLVTKPIEKQLNSTIITDTSCNDVEFIFFTPDIDFNCFSIGFVTRFSIFVGVFPAYTVLI